MAGITTALLPAGSPIYQLRWFILLFTGTFHFRYVMPGQARFPHAAPVRVVRLDIVRMNTCTALTAFSRAPRHRFYAAPLPLLVRALQFGSAYVILLPRRPYYTVRFLPTHRCRAALRDLFHCYTYRAPTPGHARRFSSLSRI